MTQPAAALVLDEHLMALRTGLDKRGMKTLTVRDFKATSTLDPDVMRAVAGGMAGAPWVLLTMDLTIVEDYRKFEWERYAIAWIAIDSHIRGIAAEYAKADVVQRHAHRFVEQRPGELFTYTQHQRHRSPPSLVSTLRRRDPSRR